MCDVNTGEPKVLMSLPDPLKEECRACRLRLGSKNEIGDLGNPDPIRNESSSMISISRCPRRAV
jgi:hypothetical protein